MSKLGDALGFGMKPKGAPEEDAPLSDPMDDGMTGDEAEAPVEDKPKAASAEEMAMKMFERATSPAAKADALRAFGEACGWGGGDY